MHWRAPTLHAQITMAWGHGVGNRGEETLRCRMESLFHPTQGPEPMNRPLPPPEARSFDRFSAVAIVVVLARLGYFGWRYFDARQSSAPVDPPAAAAPDAPPVEPAAPLEAAAVATPGTPAVEHPLEALEDTEDAAPPVPLPELEASDADVTARLSQLMGRKNVLTFLQLDGFVRRVVATVDNLPRSQASPTRWPVVPTPQRFSTLKGPDGVERIHPDNTRRYAPFVKLVESVGTGQAVAVYRGLYPLFQQAYEELGFPGRYFNDRLVQVLDHLIDTPVPAGSLEVTLVDVKGSVASLRPWVRYELADPALESMSAGRKMLMRLGPDQQRRMQAKLRDFRQQVAKP